MTLIKAISRYISGHRVSLVAILCLFGLYVQSSLPAKKTRKKSDERIYLVHSDELKYDHFGNNPDAQVVKGKVHFIHQGAQLWCDSAYFFQEANSVKAFGNVRFKQGDTLSMTCRYAEYDGQGQMMRARYDVMLKHRRQVLTTDSLDYDRLYNYAYFFEGGKLVDGKDRLVSDWGEYYLDTRQAVFKFNVKMRSEDRLIKTDTLYYDTRKSLAHIVGPNSEITSKESVVKTVDAYYDTRTKQAQLYGRSKMVDKQKEITGDSLFYAKEGESRGYGNVIYIDHENKNSLVCDELHYNEKTGKGFATKRAVLKDFSQGADTLFAHADSIKLYTFNINTDSVYRKVHCYNKVRVYRTDVQVVCDSLVVNSLDSCMTMYRDPIVWNGNRQLLGEMIKVYMNDSTIRQAEIIGQALSVEQMPDSVHYNQISSKQMNAYFVEGKIRKVESFGNVRSIYYPTNDKDSTLIGLNYLETDTMRMYMTPDRKLDRIWTNKFTSVLYPMTQIPPMRDKLDVFGWFDEIRPKDKYDIFNWRGKGEDKNLKEVKKREAPLQHLKGS